MLEQENYVIAEFQETFQKEDSNEIQELVSSAKHVVSSAKQNSDKSPIQVICAFASTVMQESWSILNSVDRLRAITVEVVDSLQSVAVENGCKNLHLLLFARILKVIKYLLYYTTKKRVERYLEAEKQNHLQSQNPGDAKDWLKEIKVADLPASSDIQDDLPPLKRKRVLDKHDKELFNYCGDNTFLKKLLLCKQRGK